MSSRQEGPIENVDEVIRQVIIRLMGTEFEAKKTVAVVQITSDESFPVYMTSQDVDDPCKRKGDAQLFTLFEFLQKITNHYNREVLGLSHIDSILISMKEKLDKLKRDISDLLDSTEDYLLSTRTFSCTETIDFLKKVTEQQLEQDDSFINAMSDLIKGYSRPNRVGIMEQGLDRLDRTTKKAYEWLKCELRDLRLEVDNIYKTQVICLPQAGLTEEFVRERKEKMSQVSKRKAFPSSIVDGFEAMQFFPKVLYDLFENPCFDLLYRGTKDGFDARNFHRCCDLKGPTLTLIKTTAGRIFGGFANESWESTINETYVADPHAFIFSWNFKEVYRQVEKFHKYSLRFHRDYGVAFGHGCDLALFSFCNSVDSNYMNINASYSSGGRSRDAIAGGSNFRVLEVEVFAVSER